MARNRICHVAVSVGRLPCNRPQTPSLHHRKGRESDGRGCCAGFARCEERTGCCWKRFKSLLVGCDIGWRWCHAGIGWVEVVLDAPSAVDVGDSRCRGPITVEGAVPAKACPQTRWISDLVSPPVPSCNRPPNSHRVPVSFECCPRNLFLRRPASQLVP